jgi:glucose 1-dehydrogenase
MSVEQIAFITGAAHGIGRAAAERLARDGYAVVLVDVDDAREGAQAIEYAGGRSLALPCDVTSEASVEEAFAHAESAFGTIDTLVNVAGINAHGRDVIDLELDQWRKVLDTNLTGAFLCARRFLRGLRDRDADGRAIVNVTSVHEEMPALGIAEYAASKGGLHMLTKSLALEAAAFSVRVNAVAPGTVLTRMTQELLDDPQALKEHEKVIPLRRAGQPSEIADAIAFLVSDNARYLTGATLVVDGGMLLNVASGPPQRG